MAGRDTRTRDGDARRRPSTSNRRSSSAGNSRNASTQRRRKPSSQYSSNDSRSVARRQNSHRDRGINTRKSNGKASTNRSNNLLRRLIARKPLFIAIILIIVIALGGLIDFGVNNGKAFAGVTVNGIDVGGLTEDEIRAKLEESFGKNVQSSSITLKGVGVVIAPNDEEPEIEYYYDDYGYHERVKQPVYEWEANQVNTGAKLPIKQVAQSALAVGREDGGLFTRLGLFFGKRDIPLELSFDEPTLESLLKKIDEEIGDPRSDATVAVEDGVATAVEGHDGSIIDREWVRSELAERMMSDDRNVSTVPITTKPAPSRITFEQAQEGAEKVNTAIENGAQFTYGTTTYDAGRADLGSWVTATPTESDDGKYELELGIDQDTATDSIFSNLDAHVTSDEISVTFEKDDEGEIVVHTQGSVMIPDVPTAIGELEEGLFGKGGAAYGGNAPTITIQETDAPETLTFNQALNMGIVTELSEYTTEYSNEETAANRNHNIHLAADSLNNSIIEANGGWWSFNETTGDTNQDPPYASAGSIVAGEYVDSIGGGICQVATTVFNAFYEAALDIPVRFNHTLYIASYPDGRDASVTYPEMDLQCTNNFESDVLLKLWYTDTSVTAAIYGVATGYEVSTEPGEWEEGEKYETDFERDDSLAEGMYYQKKYGSDGARYSVTRTVKDKDGNLISVKTFTSVYQPQNEVYVVGPGVDTKKLERDTSDSDSGGYSSTGAHDASAYTYYDASTSGTDYYDATTVGVSDQTETYAQGAA